LSKRLVLILPAPLLLKRDIQERANLSGHRFGVVSKRDREIKTRRFSVEFIVKIQRDLAAFTTPSNREQQVWRTPSHYLPVDAPKVVDRFFGSGRPREIKGSEGPAVQLRNLAQLRQRRTRLPPLPGLKPINRNLETVGCETCRKPRCLAGPDKELRVGSRLYTACHYALSLPRLVGTRPWSGVCTTSHSLRSEPLRARTDWWMAFQWLGSPFPG